MCSELHSFVDELTEYQCFFIDSIIRLADKHKYDRDCLLKEATDNLLAALEETYKDYIPEKTDTEEEFEKKLNILIGRSAFGETEELLNAEIGKVLDILKKSPMFTGRITLAMEISNRGKSVRPILYKTKYVPRENIIEPEVDGQVEITDYP